MKHKNWSQEEISYLQKNYPKLGAIFCSKSINRSEAAIRLMAVRLKLNKINLLNFGLDSRVCKTCKNELPINHFAKIKRLKPIPYEGIDPHCLSCKKEINSQKARKHYLKHQIKITSEARKRFNTDEYRKYARNYANKKRKIDVNYRIKDNCRKRINEALRLAGTKKSHHTIDLLGCSISELKTHLESQFQEGMTWENHSLHGWHIDHRKPCSSFNLVNPDEQKICFHYTNLQPLWAKDNLSKGDKLTQQNLRFY